MSMSRKDFEAIAATLRSEVGKVNPGLEPLRFSSLAAVAQGIASTAKAGNPRFDRQKFFDACGFMPGAMF